MTPSAPTQCFLVMARRDLPMAVRGLMAVVQRRFGLTDDLIGCVARTFESVDDDSLPRRVEEMVYFGNIIQSACGHVCDSEIYLCDQICAGFEQVNDRARRGRAGPSTRRSCSLW